MTVERQVPQEKPDDMAIGAVNALSQAVSTLLHLGIIRSRRFTGDLGEWYVEILYNASRARSQAEKGWDLRLPSGERAQVKTQTFDPQNRWNYLDSDTALFDRLVVVLLDTDFTIRDLYEVPAAMLKPPLVRVGSEGRPYYQWDDLDPWRVRPEFLPGYSRIARLIQKPQQSGPERKS